MISDDAILVCGTFKWPDGNIYTGEWNTEKRAMHGKGTYTWADGSTYDGTTAQQHFFGIVLVQIDYI